ncbi:WD40 repeat domain-containing protein [Lichenihabitans sp. Uapishka_5]|uniref:WD40 repeat domain-containing protein n=1 Tax=Lichenihabitans sp. Uapishka_5 TaxID=3037302 RepID=UPI0029E802A8|nr:WD40 repeat domain-containing protein [Lichenihabitans sp. Uapishka_5]MDX7949714.1 WD40 repeat domain-containing protein [Lichenihabitans sp. Uapishka_5]
MTSLLEAVTPIEAGAHVTAAAFLGGTPVLALGDGALVFAGPEPRRVEAHPDGAILVACVAGDRLLTGGDDGRVVLVEASGGSTEIGNEAGTWIDAVALRPDGAAAWTAGKTVRARSPKGEIKTLTVASTARGVAFAPKGYRLAVAHYNGASLWFPNTAEAPEALSWKGSHLDITFSPDGRFLVTSMQENAMHGWRLADAGNMRMSGYPAKPRSLSWTRDGDWLATSGAEACVVWPFEGKTGPMGKQPRECGVRPAKVTQVACHPKAMVLAIGYEDGFVLLCRLSDASELPVRLDDPSGGAVSALAWDHKGEHLLFGTRGGRAGLLRMPL